MKRAQFEILGLAIVMVIVSLGIFLLISLSLSSPDRDPAGQFVDDQFTRRVLDAFLSSNHPGCADYSIADVYVRQATGREPTCAQDLNEQAVHEQLEQAINTYMGRAYHYQVRESSCEDPFGREDHCDQLIAPSGECNPLTTEQARSARFSLPKHPYGSGAVQAVLWIC